MSIAVGNIVAKFIKRFHDDAERISLIVALQIFYVLKNENGRLFGSDDPGDIKKKGPLGVAFKAVFSAQRVLFADTGNTERLAWETGEQNIMVRNGCSDRSIRLVFRHIGKIAECNVPDI